jgi:hypothetical protein
MHPVTRLGRVIQQLTSFDQLHAGELEALAAELDGAGATDLAARVRVYRDVQRDEAQMVIDELTDLQKDMAADPAQTPPPAPPPLPPLTAGAAAAYDPAINSPRRARWLAEQAAEVERLKQPFTRRDLFGRAAPRAEDAPDPESRAAQ